MLVDTTAFFVDEKPLLCLQQTWDWLLRLLVEVKVQITLQVVRIKVVFFDTEGCRKFATIIEIVITEHHLFLAGNAFNDITLSVAQVAFDVCLSALFVDFNS